MTTILDVLKANREEVIKAYNNTDKCISLCEYMTIILNWFNEHPRVSNDCVQYRSCFFANLKKAVAIADRKADARSNREALEERLDNLNCRGWYYKNFR